MNSLILVFRLMYKPFIITLFYVLLLTGSLSAQESRKNVTTIQLKNGLNLILIENHSSPMIASVITVNAGSVNETAEINGISHMLEHLLFNGTTNRTQEQLYDEQDYYGIYNNAHTDRDYTNYIVLVEKDFIEKALDIQSDMLFHSIFPEDKFKKEKGIILNELARSSARDAYWSEGFFNRKFYQDTPYNLTILGNPGSIKQITREQVIKFYKIFYKPNNMTALVMGDFQPEAMTALFEKYFGTVAPGKIPEPESYHLNSKLTGKIYSQNIRSKNIYLNLGFSAPDVGNQDFYAFDLWAGILNLHLKDNINERLKRKNSAQLLGISSGFNFSKFLSSFTISATLPPDSDPEMIKNEIISYLKEFIEGKFQENDINGLLTSLNVNEQFLSEKPHYYGMMKGQWLSTGGWDFTGSYIDKLSEVSVEELQKAGKDYFSNPQFMTTITMPGDKKPEFTSDEFYTEKTGKTSLAGYTEESIYLSEQWKKEKKYNETSQSLPKEHSLIPSLVTREQKSNKELSDSTKSFMPSKKRGFEKTVLNNGLTLLMNSNPDSGVFAIHLLAKNRTALEPEGKEGIADFLHRLIERRTGTRDKKEFKDALNAIGAVLKTKDSPYIPYDNYYTSREFSFIRFETIDKFYREAIYNFSDLVLNPSFLEEDVEDVRAEMISLIRKESENPSIITGNLLYEHLFYKNPFSRRINGTEESISSITQQDLKNFYKYYFSPNNLIISAATSVDRGQVLKEFEKYFKSLTPVKVPPVSSEKYSDFSREKSIKVSLNKT
ncbi:MAG: insulinase family protein, partial [Nitrospinota bacterium]|nr:insulinase family protein [Nitrospinota bacterium]